MANWQAYGGETTLSHLAQMLGLTVRNFVSAATGMACLAGRRAHLLAVGDGRPRATRGVPGDTRQGWALLAAMTLVFVILLGVCVGAEQQSHLYTALGVDHASGAGHAGGNMVSASRA